ncbi:MAG: hypothetical protein HOP08_17285 [Cyclobacteriaceae bacterium]|nr:hypothetical protein [Cyclobacteriaceae bacterium]
MTGFFKVAICSGLRLSALFILMIYSESVFAQKAKDFTVVIKDLATRLENAHASSQPLRLAIVPLGNTRSKSSHLFGDYVTESITAKLSENPSKYKIFERKRLDAILKEDELMLSDLMLPEAAQKIGKLVPIDALFSGTYTKLKTYVDISARLIDVTTGEILVSFSGRIKITRNLKMLFPLNEQDETPEDLTISIKPAPVKAEPVNQKSMDEICASRMKEFQVKLNDLSTDEKVSHIAHEAMKIPFINKCGEIHFEVMYYFNRYKIIHPEYETFLLSTLDTIAFPSLDDRAFNIIKFAARDSVIDARDWKVGLHTMMKTSSYLSTYVGYLLGKSKSSADESQERIDTYFKLVSDGKMGLPKAISMNQAFLNMMSGLRYGTSLREYVYPKYAPFLTLDTYTAGKVYHELADLYLDEDDPAKKTMIMEWIADFFNKHSDEKSHEHLYDFARSFELTDDEDRNKKIVKEYPARDLKLLVNRCKDKFSEYAMKTPYKNQQEDRIRFCVANNIPVPGVITSISQADQILKGSDLKEQLRVMKLLFQMGDRPKPIESTIISLLSKRSINDKETMTEIQVLAMAILGHIKSQQPAAIDYMTSKLMSYNYDESEHATAALLEIGKPSVAPLIKLLNKTTIHDGGLRYKIVVILGKLGPLARSAEPSLLKLKSENSNSDIQYAIEAALQSIN